MTEDHDAEFIKATMCPRCGALDRNVVTRRIWCNCHPDPEHPRHRAKPAALDETEYFIVIDTQRPSGKESRRVLGPYDRPGIAEARDAEIARHEKANPKLQFTYHVAKMVYHETRAPNRPPVVNPRMKPHAG